MYIAIGLTLRKDREIFDVNFSMPIWLSQNKIYKNMHLLFIVSRLFLIRNH